MSDLGGEIGLFHSHEGIRILRPALKIVFPKARHCLQWIIAMIIVSFLYT